MLALLALPGQALAQGATDYPIPSNAGEAYSPIREGFESPIQPRDDLRGLKRHYDPRLAGLEEQRKTRWPNAPAFLRDTDLRTHSRTYWFDEDQFGLDEPEALTTGGDILYQSGAIADFFQLRGALYTTQPLYANATAGDTDNLSPGGDQITTLGQINGRIRFAGQELTAGRQLVRTPYVNPYDIRMIPLTFEGIVLLPEHHAPLDYIASYLTRYKPWNDGDFISLPEHHAPLDYIASYLTRYKPWNDGDFISFSEGLGIDEDEGMLITGASYSARSWNAGVANYWVEDALNTAYAEIDYVLRDDDIGPSVRVGVNLLDQRTVGADLIAGAPYDTYQASARLVASYRGFVFTGAVSQTGDEADIQKPFGFSTSYTAMVITSFEQASVRAYMVSLSYDFARVGLEGVTFQVAWGRGDGEPDLATNGGFADQDELDLRFVYQPHQGRLQGLRVELEYIDWQVFGLGFPSDDLTQLRAIVNYSVPLL